MKIPKDCSVRLSLGLTAVFFLVLLAAAFFMPHFVRLIAPVSRLGAGEWTCFWLMAGGYLTLVFSALADGLLFRLLLLVARGEVFTPPAVGCIRGVSWCCFAVSLLFAVLSRFFLMAWVICWAAVLLGLCLRVVKNVIEEATTIKAENDLTV